MSSSRERLKQLEEIEQDVVTVIESASQSLLELSKEQPSEDYVISSTTRFLKGRFVKTDGVYVGMCLSFKLSVFLWFISDLHGK